MLRRDPPLFPAALLPLLLAALGAAGCSGSPDVKGWQERTAAARPRGARATLGEEARRVEELRARLDLAGARSLALSLAAENPQDAAALLLASRAESDAVFLLPAADGEGRKLAALSALDYARRAVAAGADGAAPQAQFAWAMGTSTHLQPMFQRSEHAQKTLQAIEKARALEPENPTALATLSILRLRLATLPWIARVMASGAPEGSIEEAVTLARRSVEVLPSLENRLILARALIAAERRGEAVAALEAALKTPDAHPRDRELRPVAQALFEGDRKEG